MVSQARQNTAGRPTWPRRLWTGLTLEQWGDRPQKGDRPREITQADVREAQSDGRRNMEREISSRLGDREPASSPPGGLETENGRHVD
jgi:hypothetical protein